MSPEKVFSYITGSQKGVGGRGLARDRATDRPTIVPRIVSPLSQEREKKRTGEGNLINIEELRAL